MWVFWVPAIKVAEHICTTVEVVLGIMVPVLQFVCYNVEITDRNETFFPSIRPFGCQSDRQMKMGGGA